jgi:hypothetical protein
MTFNPTMSMIKPLKQDWNAKISSDTSCMFDEGHDHSECICHNIGMVMLLQGSKYFETLPIKKVPYYQK